MKLHSYMFLAVSVAMVGCASSAAPGAAESDVSAASTPSWQPVMDECVQVAVSAAAVQAFGNSNLQHLEALSVEGDLAVEGTLTITVTTGNDEDGDRTRKVEVAQKINTTTGAVSCQATKIDGQPTTQAFDANALEAIVDPCTGAAIVAAQKISENYWHLYGLTLKGNPAQSGKLDYVVTQSNDEDGDTNFAVVVEQSIDLTTGKASCKVTSAKSDRP